MNSTVVQAAPRQGSSGKARAIFDDQVRAALNHSFHGGFSIRTTDATPKQVFAAVMPPNCAWVLEYRVCGYSAAGDAGAYHEIRRYKRVASAAPALLSNAAPVADYEDVAGWAVTMAAAADGTISLSVTGAAAATIDWFTLVDIIQAPSARR